ncbi:Zn2Cys6 transcriptional regulator [Trichoderma guizhouense]|uniref:Zn2Cys6 transcriptional regulator n=1 Tax=Trichoderma guizhouense TaxID=1491466 RepID=A0A1T3C8Y2_9HYPO|nr:Zn2Cys6 transcriptional regulator [Trichoderma guizhouense]
MEGAGHDEGTYVYPQVTATPKVPQPIGPFDLYPPLVPQLSISSPLALRPSPSHPQFFRSRLEASASGFFTPPPYFFATHCDGSETQSPPSLCFSPSISSSPFSGSVAVMDLDPPAGADVPPYGLAGSSLPGEAHPHPSLANPADGPGLSLDRRPKKSSTTCAVCRFRKVRCNGARPCCGNCQRLGFPCSYDDADVDAWSMSLPRRRVKQACLSCHSRKARCSGHLPSCERCRVQGIECVYRPNKRAKPSSAGAGIGDSKSPNSPDRESDRDGGARENRGQRENDEGRNESPALTDAASSASDHHEGPHIDESFNSIVSRAFDLFFRHVHHMAMFTFLHRASLMEQYHAGKVERPLLLAIVGITSCLTDMGPGMREYGNRCINDAEALLLADYSRPSIVKIQALIFVIKHRILCNKFSSAFVLHSFASRYATALRLNYEAPHLRFLAQESRRRLMWAMYCIDTSICGGYPDFVLWRADQIHVYLPCNERNFEFDLPQQTEKLVPDSHQPRPPLAEDVGTLALHARILHIRQKIIEFTKVAQYDRGMEAAELQGRIFALDKELNDFATNLPTSFQFSENSLRLRAYSPRLCVFVMIHIWWRQCYCDLYRLALADINGGLPQSMLDMFDQGFLEHCHRQCVDHSLALTLIFSLIQKLDAKPVADIDLAMCAYQCARMLMYLFQSNIFSRFGVAADTVMEQAQLCLQTIKDCCVGPAVDCIVADLERLVNRDARAVTGEGVVSTDLSQPQITDASGVLNAPATTGLQAFNPSSGAVNNTVSPFTHPVMTAPWMSETAFTPGLDQQTLPPDVHADPTKGGTPNLSAPRSEYGQSELNNEYDGTFAGLGLDDGFDYNMGVDMNMWATNGGSWTAPGFGAWMG